MEQVYPPSDYHCSEPIHLRQYFEDYFKALENPQPTTVLENKSQILYDTVKANLSNLSRLDKTYECSVNLLDVPGEPPTSECPKTSLIFWKNKVNFQYKMNAQASKLNVMKVYEEHDKRKCCIHYAHEWQGCAKKYYTFGKEDEDGSEQNLTCGSDFVVLVRVYYPFETCRLTRNKRTNLKLSHEILALGTNTLADLKDSISCINELGTCIEVDSPDQPAQLATSKERYPSGFFLINSTFYNDTRNKNCIDYSEVILNWAQKKNLGPFATAKMEDSKICDLTVRFGYPYVFQHQGECEHIISFSDAWILGPEDSLISSKYPIHTSISRITPKYCCFCNTELAIWVVVESNRLPYMNTFLCDSCFRSYNYNLDKKIGTFKAYHYFDHTLA